PGGLVGAGGGGGDSVRGRLESRHEETILDVVPERVEPDFTGGGADPPSPQEPRRGGGDAPQAPRRGQGSGPPPDSQGPQRPDPPLSGGGRAGRPHGAGVWA